MNVENESTSAMRSDGTALLMLADLIRYFSVYSLPGATAGTSQSNDTLREIITYVNEHYTEKLSLEEVANQMDSTGNISAVFSNSIWALHFSVT